MPLYNFVGLLDIARKPKRENKVCIYTGLTFPCESRRLLKYSLNQSESYYAVNCLTQEWFTPTNIISNFDTHKFGDVCSLTLNMDNFKSINYY